MWPSPGEVARPHNPRHCYPPRTIKAKTTLLDDNPGAADHAATVPRPRGAVCLSLSAGPYWCRTAGLCPAAVVESKVGDQAR